MSILENKVLGAVKNLTDDELDDFIEKTSYSMDSRNIENAPWFHRVKHLFKYGKLTPVIWHILSKEYDNRCNAKFR